ncbi:hypothetical protein QJ856_gp0593 [Tupanvirus deep ocean]|uniref:Uncharacterized protein n=2 Tax=Tupanvirus TaxID=2094720 RepID=A0AC62A935_9VIRU|nr:hypothetical protein QJ856_gp0593 [Tupanvirus deep ocean]QKU34153.1 hypothetical protein [Tupanvirus deep ocean]
MPNHVANFVIITGAPAEVKRFWTDATTSKNIDENGKFSFDNVYPIPKNFNWYEWSIEK